MNTRAASRSRGFSLVEVCLAVLVVGLGLLAIFALFPTGLASIDDAAGDTTVGLFANQKLTKLIAEADDKRPVAGGNIDAARLAWAALIDNAAGSSVEDEVAYTVTVEDRGENVKEVTLSALPWGGGSFPSSTIFNEQKLVFYTELHFAVLP